MFYKQGLVMGWCSSVATQW